MMRAGDLCSHLSANIVEELIPLSGEVRSLIFYNRPDVATEIELGDLNERTLIEFVNILFVLSFD